MPPPTPSTMHQLFAVCTQVGCRRTDSVTTSSTRKGRWADTAAWSPTSPGSPRTWNATRSKFRAIFFFPFRIFGFTSAIFADRRCSKLTSKNVFFNYYVLRCCRVVCAFRWNSKFDTRIEAKIYTKKEYEIILRRQIANSMYYCS